MLSILFIFFAATGAAISNLVIRMGLNPTKSLNGFLFIFYLTSMFFTLAMFYEILASPINYPMVAAGMIQGGIVVLLTQLTAAAMKKGPAALTFAFRNASAVFPPLILFILFGPSFGFIITPVQLLGMTIVVIGLFFAARQKNSDGIQSIPKSWFLYAICCFAIQGLASTIVQWRCLLFTQDLPSHLLIPFSCAEADDGWFLPAGFAMASILQLILFLREKRIFESKELYLGGLGGLLNGSCGFFLILATKWASPVEKVILFPLFAVLIIMLCNLWGRIIYNERVNILGNAVCCFGIFVASLG
jgi:drug/metabolite transporter (DMT)-like permease